MCGTVEFRFVIMLNVQGNYAHAMNCFVLNIILVKCFVIRTVCVSTDTNMFLVVLVLNIIFTYVYL